MSLYFMGLPRWLKGKESACSTRDAGDVGSIPSSGSSLGGQRSRAAVASMLGLAGPKPGPCWPALWSLEWLSLSLLICETGKIKVTHAAR